MTFVSLFHEVNTAFGGARTSDFIVRYVDKSKLQQLLQTRVQVRTPRSLDCTPSIVTTKAFLLGDTIGELSHARL